MSHLSDSSTSICKVCSKIFKRKQELYSERKNLVLKENKSVINSNFSDIVIPGAAKIDDSKWNQKKY